MEASLTAAAVSLPPPRIRPQITKPSPLPRPRRLQFGIPKIRTSGTRACLAAASSSTPPAPGGGLYSAATYELTAENVDRVLDDVRPTSSLTAETSPSCLSRTASSPSSSKVKKKGACGSCPSLTTTMNMGIERVLKEKFGDAFKETRQVFDGDQPPAETTPEAVNRHLDILRPAIANYGGSVDVLAIDGEDCLVRYDGPESIGSGIKAAIKEKFPDITNVVFMQ